MVSAGVTVCGRSSGWDECTAESILSKGSSSPCESSIGESRAVLVTYLGVGMSAAVLVPAMYWSSKGKVWLRGRWEFAPTPVPGAGVVAGRIGRAVKGGTKGLGAVPESGVVKKGDVGLSGPGEKDEGAVSVKALLRLVVLCEW